MSTKVTPHCPSCAAPMKRAIRPYEVTYKDRTKSGRVSADWCDACGDAILEGPALIEIERAYVELRAEVDGALAPIGSRRGE